MKFQLFVGQWIFVSIWSNEGGEWWEGGRGKPGCSDLVSKHGNLKIELVKGQKKRRKSLGSIWAYLKYYFFFFKTKRWQNDVEPVTVGRDSNHVRNIFC